MDSTARAKLRDKNQVTLPANVRKALCVQVGDEVEFTVSESGGVELRGYVRVPADQRWFWTPEWQRGEREVSEQISAGELTDPELVDDVFADLNHSDQP